MEEKKSNKKLVISIVCSIFVVLAVVATTIILISRKGSSEVKVAAHPNATCADPTSMSNEDAVALAFDNYFKSVSFFTESTDMKKEWDECKGMKLGFKCNEYSADLEINDLYLSINAPFLFTKTCYIELDEDKLDSQIENSVLFNDIIALFKNSEDTENIADSSDAFSFLDLLDTDTDMSKEFYEYDAKFGDAIKKFISTKKVDLVKDASSYVTYSISFDNKSVEAFINDIMSALPDFVDSGLKKLPEGKDNNVSILVTVTKDCELSEITITDEESEISFKATGKTYLAEDFELYIKGTTVPADGTEIVKPLDIKMTYSDAKDELRVDIYEDAALYKTVYLYFSLVKETPTELPKNGINLFTLTDAQAKSLEQEIALNIMSLQIKENSLSSIGSLTPAK